MKRTIKGYRADGKVLLFNSAAEPSRAARLHTDGCSMIRAAYRVRDLTAEELAEDIADLEERQFPVGRCKCLG